MLELPHEGLPFSFGRVRRSTLAQASEPIARLALVMIFVVPPVWADAVADGQKLATSGDDGIIACATCHGAKGEGMAAAGFPYLAGQGATYLAEQLQHFASGARKGPVMEPIAKAMTPVQIDAVSSYFSQLAQPFDATGLSNMVDTYPEKSATGAWIANRGEWDNNIPACIQCHGPGGVGVGASFPALAGLPASYIRQQLMDWKGNTRHDGPLSLMGDIARRMSEAQIDAVSDYFAVLPGGAGGAPAASDKKGAK